MFVGREKLKPYVYLGFTVHHVMGRFLTRGGGSRDRGNTYTYIHRDYAGVMKLLIRYGRRVVLRNFHVGFTECGGSELKNIPENIFGFRVYLLAISRELREQ